MTCFSFLSLLFVVVVCCCCLFVVVVAVFFFLFFCFGQGQTVRRFCLKSLSLGIIEALSVCLSLYLSVSVSPSLSRVFVADVIFSKDRL